MCPADTCASKTCQLSSGWDHYRAGGAPQKCRSAVTAACLPSVGQFLSQLGSAPVSAPRCKSSTWGYSRQPWASPPGPTRSPGPPPGGWAPPSTQYRRSSSSCRGSSWGRSPDGSPSPSPEEPLPRQGQRIRSRSRADQKASAQPAEATPILGADGAIDTLEGICRRTLRPSVRTPKSHGSAAIPTGVRCSTGCHPGSGPSGSRVTDRPRIDDLPRRAKVLSRAAGAAHRPAKPVNARLPDGRPRRTRGHHPGELDQLTQAATEDVLGAVPSALANRDFIPLFK
jgi:hypothetical protein